MSGSEKRKHKTLTLQTKTEIIRKLDNGAKLKELAAFYGVGRATIHDIGKKRDKIMGYLSVGNGGHRKTMKSGEYPKVEKALYDWYSQEKNRADVTTQMLREQAKRFYRAIMKKEDFKASSGWLDKFKKRYGLGIPECQASSELTETEEKPADFLQQLQARIEENLLGPDQVYHLQEGRLFWKLQSYKSYLRSMPESRFSILSCANASGTHRIPLVLTGGSRAQENRQIPIKYKHVFGRVNAREMFEDWFQNDFVPQVKEVSKRTRILLVLENSYDYRDEEELNPPDELIKVMFLPTNVIEQNVIEDLKTNYKKKFLVNLVSEGLKHQISLQNAIDLVAEVWQNLPSDSFTSSWSKFWPASFFNGRNVATVNFVDVQISDLTQSLVSSTHLTEEDVEAWLTENYEDIDEESVNATMDVVSHENALAAFETCVRWAEENGVSYEDVLVLRKVQSQVFVKKMLEETGGVKEECSAQVL